MLFDRIRALGRNWRGSDDVLTASLPPGGFGSPVPKSLWGVRMTEIERRLRTVQEFAEARGLILGNQQDERGTCQLSLYSPEQPPQYRYAFARWWADAGPLVLWVGLNPGTGDTESRRRPSLERFETWSRRLGMGGLLIGNLFAVRTKAVKDVAAETEAVGEHNDDALRLLSGIADQTIAAWGGRGGAGDRATSAAQLLRRPLCLGT